MSEKVSLIRTRENQLEFEISITGTKNKGTEVRFVIESDSMQYSFPCKESSENKWDVTIPAMSHLDAKDYPYHIEIVTDGYFFKPLEGEVVIEEAPEVKATKTTHVAAPTVGTVKVKASPKKKEVKEEVEEVEDPVVEAESEIVDEPVIVEEEEEVFENLAEELISKGYKTPRRKPSRSKIHEKKVPVKTEKPVLRESNLTAALKEFGKKKVEPKTEADKKVLDILSGLKH